MTEKDKFMGVLMLFRYAPAKTKKLRGMYMLFQKKMEPRCAYCARSTALDESSALCVKKGLVSLAGHCRAFQYDPLKRIPPKPLTPDFSRLREEDFVL